MKKILLLMVALFTLGGVTVSAKKVYADLSKLGNGPVSTWDGTTQSITWTQQSNNMISNFDFAAGDYRSYDKIVVSVSDLNNAIGVRVQIKANGKEKTVALNGEGTFEKVLTTDFGFEAADLQYLEWIRLLGSGFYDGENHTINAENPASAKINSVYLEEPTKTLDVDLSQMAASEGYATWNKETGTFAWTVTYSNAITLPGLSGNLSAYTTLNYETTAGTCNHFRILIYYSNGAAQTTYKAEAGSKSVTFKEMGVDLVNLASVSSIKISGANDATGDITVSSISLEGPFVSFIEATTTYEAPIGTTDLNGMTGAGDIKWNIAYPQSVKNETLWGGDIDSDNQSVSISDYDYLHFVVTNTSADAHTGLRVFVWDGSARQCLYPHPIKECAGVTDWKATTWITEPGVYVVKISGYPLLRGFKALQGWAGNAGSIDISMAYVSKGDAPAPYLPSGKYTLIGEATGSVTLTAALADPNAKIYDATGVTGTGLELTPTNPNAIFVANEGALVNNQNVCVNGNINYLSLTDGYPFKAPAGATASNANYSRENMNKWGTVCLPYAVTSSESAQFYSIDGIDGDVLKVTALDNVPAGVPALVNVTNGAFAVSAKDVELADVQVSNSTTPLYGTYEYKDITADDAANYYAISNNQFVQATGNIELGAFRAYFTAPKSSPANLRIPAGETTAIEALTGEGDATVVGIYSANGAQQRSLQKGINVIKLSNGKTQKVLVK